MREIQNKKIIEEYNVLRVILTILVVVGHSIGIRSVTAFGGCDYTGSFSDGTFILKIFSLLHSIIYSFHMPCFFALSGALFYKAVVAERYKTLKQLVKEKILRLLLPYIIISVFWVFPWKMISGYYISSDNVWLDFFVGQLLLQGNSHLWFLATLFFIFIVIYFMRFAKKKYVLSVLFFAYIFSFLCPINIVMFVLKYSFWFYLGYVLETYRNRFNSKICLKLFLGIIFLFMASYFCGRFFAFTGFFVFIKSVIEFITALSGIASVYIFSVYMAKTCLTKKKCFQSINKYSFGIYLYSDTLNYPILCVMFYLCGNIIFTSAVGYLLLFFIRVIVSMVISIMVTKGLRYLKIKYIC